MFGFVSGLGAASADAIYGCVAGFGLTIVSSLLIEQQIWLRLIGGLFLCCLAIKTFWEKPAKDPSSSRADSLAAAYISTLILTLTNPMTVLSFAAIFAGLGLAEARGDLWSAGALVTGVFAGSALWWLFLSSSVGIFQDKLELRGMMWLNRVSATIIGGFGLSVLLGLLR